MFTEEIFNILIKHIEIDSYIVFVNKITINKISMLEYNILEKNKIFDYIQIAVLEIEGTGLESLMLEMNIE